MEEADLEEEDVQDLVLAVHDEAAREAVLDLHVIVLAVHESLDLLADLHLQLIANEAVLTHHHLAKTLDLHRQQPTEMERIEVLLQPLAHLLMIRAC